MHFLPVLAQEAVVPPPAALPEVAVLSGPCYYSTHTCALEVVMMKKRQIEGVCCGIEGGSMTPGSGAGPRASWRPVRAS